jgi:NADPH:quinone reductase-like Zn-dependent oxidoreductase
MKAVTMTGYGTRGTVHVRDVPEPTPGDDDLLVDVHAAGINPLDVKIRDGKLRLVRRFPLPAIMGNELSGVVAAIGRAVHGFAVGDSTFARADKRHLGAFAERACVHQSHAAHKPSRLSMAEAAGVPLAALTAWQALELLGVGAGSRVLVHAGAGGVGSFAVQLAKLRGAWVASTAPGRNLALVRDLGADQVIDYTAQRFEEVLEPVDGVFDTMGGEVLARSLRATRRDGLVVSMERSMRWPMSRPAVPVARSCSRSALLTRDGASVRLLRAAPGPARSGRAGVLGCYVPGSLGAESIESKRSALDPSPRPTALR